MLQKLEAGTSLRIEGSDLSTQPELAGGNPFRNFSDLGELPMKRLQIAREKLNLAFFFTARALTPSYFNS